MPKICSECDLPQIHRASGYYLYDRKGRRYVDFWQEDGWAILGHRPLRMMKELKNTLSRGVWGKIPSVEETRLVKAVKQLLPGWHPWRVCFTLQEVGRVIEEREGHFLGVADPLLEDTAECMLWRPFLKKKVPSDSKYLLPILPFPWAPRPWIICTKQEHQEFQASLSPVLCAVLKRAIYDIMHALAENLAVPALTVAGWKQTGRYLVYGGQSYADRVQALRQCGILISPHCTIAIVPPHLTDNELICWKNQGLDKTEN